jgi:O-antigen biosynthesis protein
MTPQPTVPPEPATAEPPRARSAPQTLPRAASRGKFLYADGEKLYVRGVTYGPFRPGDDGESYRPDRAAADFRLMAASGINAIRTYTVPPTWLLDLAQQHGLRVMVGLPWEQHVAFLDDPAIARRIQRSVRDLVRSCAGHPAVLCYLVGNEIPAPIVRWHGPRRIERFLTGLYRIVKEEDPAALVSYVNYPTTEYLQLPELDLVCFNVFLESPEALERYLRRLQNLAGERPLLLTEVGLDSLSHGEQKQAEAIGWQLAMAFRTGCAGAFVFSWTDEWYRGGEDIQDWAFGLTTRERVPKPALLAVQRAFEEVPVPVDEPLPRISVVVATYNGAATLPQCCAALERLRYPHLELILVDDGSTDDSARIGAEHGMRVIRTENRGLAAARNTGIVAATGDIVAFVDDDAYPDPDWLTYLALGFGDPSVAGVGGPNLPVPGDGAAADCVAAAPGGPTHVLLSDSEAEHIPGCNMAFRKQALDTIAGFDERFRAAGDDVDLCWRMRERGWRLGFAPGATVWHHRRGSVGGYLKQQRGYGAAEALLERKWPNRYSAGGHVSWIGRIYGDGIAHSSRRLRWRVYYGVWGSNLFQPLYQPAGAGIDVLGLLPEVYLAMTFLGLLCALGLLWSPLLVVAPALALLLGLLVVRAVRVARAAIYPTPDLSPLDRAVRTVVTAMLHLLQPLSRLVGRMNSGLTLWRRRGSGGFALARPRRVTLWNEDAWRSGDDWRRELGERLLECGGVFSSGGEFDRFDLEVRGGTLAGSRLRLAVEEHGQGRQLVRVRVWPRVSPGALALPLVLAPLASAAALDGAPAVAIILGAVCLGWVLRTVQEAGASLAVALNALRRLDPLRREPK